MYGKYRKKSYKGKKKKYYTPAEKASFYAGLKAGKRLARSRKSSSKRRW